VIIAKLTDDEVEAIIRACEMAQDEFCINPKMYELWERIIHRFSDGATTDISPPDSLQALKEWLLERESRMVIWPIINDPDRSRRD